MSISSLPSEVLETIFSFLDGESFSKSREVCTSWNKIIKNMQKKQCYWKKFCVREIPINVLEEILGYKSKVWDGVDWRLIYKKWFNSRMIVVSPYWKKKIYSLDNNPITCACVSGSWVITGHSNGLICVWNLMTGNLSQTCMCHLKIINDMALVDLLNLGSYSGLDDLPWSHHHMITISKDRYISIIYLLEEMTNSDSRIQLNYHTDDIKQIKIFGDIFAIRSQDNTLSLWKMKLARQPLFKMQVNLLQKVIGPEDYLLSVGLWHDEVQCISNSGKMKSLTIHEDGWVEQREFFKSSPDSDIETIVAVTAAFLYRQKLVIMLTSDGKLIFSIDKDCCKSFHLMKSLKTDIVSIAFYGTILALGGENGRLFLYYISSEEDLMSTDISQPNATLQLSEASIISIDISYQDYSPVIAASTNDSIHIIKWYKSSTAHQKLRKRDLSHLFA